MTGARSVEAPAGAPDGAQQHQPGRTRTGGRAATGGGRLAVEVPAVVVAAVAVSAAVQAAVSRLPVLHPSNVPTALTVLAALAVTGVVLAACAARDLPRWVLPLGLVALPALATLVLALPLHGTPWYLGGNTEDQTFRAQYVGRYADDPALADMNYADTAPFYPAGWFWIAGRSAALTGTPAWEAFKPVAIATVAVVPAVVALVWARLAGPRRGLLVGLVTTAAAVHEAGAGPFAGEAYSWCLAALVPAVAVAAVRAFEPARVAGRWRAALGIGVFLGLAAMTYTLYAGFAALVVAAACALGVVRGRRSGEGVGAALRTRVPALVLAAVVSAALAATVWAPFVLARLSGAGGQAAAQRFLPRASAVLPTPMLEASAWGALLLAGVVWMVLRARTDTAARGLLLLTALLYAWYPLSTLALAAGTSLLAFRLEAVLVATLAAAGCLAAADAWRTLRGLRAEQVVRVRRPLAVLGALAVAAAVVGTLQQAPVAAARGLEHAWNDYTADGRTPAGVRDENAAGAWTPQVLAAVDDLTDRPARDLVVLSSLYELTTFAPWRGYQQMTAHYANPLADFDARREEIRSWAQATSPGDLLERLDSGPFRAPDVFVLFRGAEDLEIGVTHDLFPREPNVGWETVRFDPALFGPEHFTTREVGPFTVVARTR
ncbi:galactan 5-O-arabinofuranosyltransferase [Kineococcus sp. NUM-3379]